MRSIWFRGVAVTASITLAFAMLLINIAFEIAGSVPDVEGCGFLAGNLVALFALYPLAAGLIAARAAGLLARRFPDAEGEIVRLGSRIGFKGAALYFLIGILNVALGSRFAAASPMMWGLLALYTLLAALAGRLGAALVVAKIRTLAWREGGQ